MDKARTPRSGRVETWDQGAYELLARDTEKLVLRFNGERLRGYMG